MNHYFDYAAIIKKLFFFISQERSLWKYLLTWSFIAHYITNLLKKFPDGIVPGKSMCNLKNFFLRNFSGVLHDLLPKISTKNIELWGSWSLSKFSIFQTNSLVFSEIVKLCLNLGIEFCITWLVLPNYKKNHSIKSNWNLTTQATLIIIISYTATWLVEDTTSLNLKIRKPKNNETTFLHFFTLKVFHKGWKMDWSFLKFFWVKAIHYTLWKVSAFRVFLVRIQSECGKMRTRKTSNTDNFHAVLVIHFQSKTELLSPFIHNVKKRPNISENLAVFNSQYF